MFRRSVMLLCVLSIVFAGAGVASAVALPVVYDGIADLGPVGTFNPGISLNNTYAVTSGGNAYWSLGGGLVSLPTSMINNATYGYARAINDAGQITGMAGGGTNVSVGNPWVYSISSGLYTPLTGNSRIGGSGQSISASGLIGGVDNNTGAGYIGIWPTTSTFLDFHKAAAGTPASSAFGAINDAGKCAVAIDKGSGGLGQYAYYIKWTNSPADATSVNINASNVGSSYYAYGVNDQGMVAGKNFGGAQTLGACFGLPNNGTQYHLALLPGATYASSASNAWAISDGLNPIVVGFGPNASGVQTAIAWTTNSTTGASTAINLNTLLPANSGWVLTQATGISDNGWIVGRGTYQSASRAFALYLNPVPEPSALLLAATGLVGLVAYAWRKRK